MPKKRSSTPSRVRASGTKPSLWVGAAAIENYVANGCDAATNLKCTVGRASGFLDRMRERGNSPQFFLKNSQVKCALFTDPKILGAGVVDCFYFAGHSGHNGPFLGWGAGYDSDTTIKKSMVPADYRWASNNLKWMLIDACYAFYDGQQEDKPLNWTSGKFALDRWKQVFHPGGAANPAYGSLRVIFGNRANGFDVYFSTGSHFTDNCYDRKYSVGQAWLDAVDWTQYCGGIMPMCPGVAPCHMGVGQYGTNFEWHGEQLTNLSGNPGNFDPASLYVSAKYIWKGKPLFFSPPTRTNRLPVLRGETPTTRASRSAWLGAMDVRGDTQKSALFDFAQDGRRQVSIHRDTGAQSFANLDFMWGNNPAMRAPVAGKVTKGQWLRSRPPTPAAAKRAADAFIRQQGWNEQGEWALDSIGGLMSSRRGETKEQHGCDNRIVTYLRTVEGVPVTGAGSRLVVHVGEGGEIIGASHDAPTLSAKSKAPVALKEQKAASREIDGAVSLLNRQFAPDLAITAFKPQSTQLGYYGSMAPDGARELIPAYIVTGTATRKNGTKFSIGLPIAASDDHPIKHSVFNGTRR